MGIIRFKEDKETFRVGGKRGLEFISGIFQTAFRSYILDKWKHRRIQNDMGASFTQISRMRDRIIKKADAKGEKKLIDEINWNLFFQNKAPLNRYLPKIYNYSLEAGNVYYAMKYYSFPNFRKIILDDMNTTAFIKKRWGHLLDIMFKLIYVEKNAIDSDNGFFSNHHLLKYRDRVRETLNEAPELKPLFENPIIYINGEECLSSHLIIDYIERNPAIQAKLTPKRLYRAHGDLHCNNILCGISSNDLILLDCRGKSPAGTDYFDPAYDIAKIYHDLRSYYSLIENGMYEISFVKEKNRVHLNYAFKEMHLVERFNRNFFYVRDLIEKKYSDFNDINYRADFTEGMLYITMVPMHLRVPDEGLICLATGIYRLNRWLKQYHGNVFQEIYNNVKEKRWKLSLKA